MGINFEEETMADRLQVYWMLQQKGVAPHAVLCHMETLEDSGLRYSDAEGMVKAILKLEDEATEYAINVDAILTFFDRHNLVSYTKNEETDKESVSVNTVGVAEVELLIDHGDLYALFHLEQLQQQGRTFKVFDDLLEAVKDQETRSVDLRQKAFAKLVRLSPSLPLTLSRSQAGEAFSGNTNTSASATSDHRIRFEITPEDIDAIFLECRVGYEPDFVATISQVINKPNEVWGTLDDLMDSIKQAWDREDEVKGESVEPSSI